MRLNRILGACAFVAFAFALRTLLDPLLGERSPFLFFTLAVLLAGATFGLRIGLIVTALSALVGRWAFLAPRHSFAPMTSDEWMNIAAFVATSLAMLIFTNQLTRSRAAEAASAAESAAAESLARESQQRLAGIVDSAMDAIITINKQQNIILFNPAAERMFGYSASEMIGQPLLRLIPNQVRPGHEDLVEDFREEGVASRRIHSRGAVSGLRASGEEFPIDASISHVEIAGEELTTVILRDVTERKLNEEAQILLAREVDHRAKNALAVAQALVSMTRANTVQEYGDAIAGRISSLARAHSLLSRSRWTGASLRQVVRDETETYARDSQIVASGPEITLTAEAVQPLSLVFHELATNALKHGALSSETGVVSVTWKVVGEALQICWVETGGPGAAEPSKLGFGSKLLQTTIKRQLRAELQQEWLPEGLTVRMSVPSELFSMERSEIDQDVAHTTPSREKPAGNGRNVLVVEDEELVAMELCGELQRLGWTVFGPASTISEAAETLEKMPSIDAAVLDVNLRGRPVYPFAERLAERQVPFLFCTGYEIVDPAGRFQSAPVIRKPAARGVVGAALHRLLKAA